MAEVCRGLNEALGLLDAQDRRKAFFDLRRRYQLRRVAFEAPFPYEEAIERPYGGELARGGHLLAPAVEPIDEGGHIGLGNG